MAKPRGIGDQIIQLRNGGLNYDQIKDQLKCSKNTVAYHCKKHGLTDIGFKNVRVSNEVAQAIKDFFKDGENTLDMAVSHFDLSKSTIKKYKNPKFDVESAFDENKESHVD